MSGKKDDKMHEQYSMFDAEVLTVEKAAAVKTTKVLKPCKSSDLDVDTLQISDTQPRHYIDEERLEELCSSIGKHGVLQPVIVQLGPDGTNQLVAGQRRLLAARKAGLKRIPVVFTDGDPAEIALIENLQRSDLTAVEEAEAISRLKEVNGYTLDDLSAITGKSRSTLSETISLTRLPDQVKDACRCDSAIAKSILVEIARQSTVEGMLKAYEDYRKDNLQRAQIRRLNKPAPAGRKSAGIAFVRSFNQRLVTVDVSTLRNKQREIIKGNLEELYTTIGGLLDKLKG